MAIDISGLFFFMPVVSFLFVFLIVYALLTRFQPLGESGFINAWISFLIAVIFMSFSSLELYVRTITPWFVVLIVIVFFVLLTAGFATGKIDKIMTTGFGWFFVALLLLIFLIAAIAVFNPIFHPDLVITEGGDGPGIVSQFRGLLESSSVAGSLLLLIIATVVAWWITKK